MPHIPQRIRKLIGVFVLLIWLAFYAMCAMLVAIAVLPEANWFVEFLYYAVAGMAWIVPVRYLMLWMNKPDPGTI